MTIRNFLVVATVAATCANAMEAAASGDVVKNEKAGEATVNMFGAQWSAEVENQTESLDIEELVQSVFNYSSGEEPLSPPIELGPGAKTAEEASEDPAPETVYDGSDFGEPQLVDASQVEEKFRHFFKKDEVMAVLQRTRTYMKGLGELTDDQVEYCYNYESDCSFWAASGECVKNPDYMQYDCAPACQSCEAVWEEVAKNENNAREEGPGSAYGVIQIVDPSTVEEPDMDSAKVLAKIAEVDEYMSEQVQDGSDPCLNYFAMCSIWAVKGWCESNEELMLEDCMPACQVCHLDMDEPLTGEEFGVKQILDRSEISEKFQSAFDEDAVRAHLESTAEYMEDLSDEDALECLNEDSLCTWSAAVGECTKNPDYMMYNCAPACKSCHKLQEEEEEEIDGPGYAYGVIQIMDPSSVNEDSVDKAAVEAKLEETNEYMSTQDPETCYNVYAMCTTYAVQGLCESDPEMMNYGCAPACKTCGVAQDTPEVKDRMMSESEMFGPGEEFGVEQIISKDDVVPQFQYLFDEVAVQNHLQETLEYMESLPEEDLEDCYNQDSFCTFSAVTGECEMNPDYMLYECAPACKSCDKLREEGPEPEGPGSNYGVVQILDPSKLEGQTVEPAMVQKRLEAIDEYMKEKEGSKCVNVYAMCTLWSVQGWCDTEAELMDYDCPAACMNCENERFTEYLAEEEALMPGEEFGVEQMVKATEMVEEYRHLFDEAEILKLLEETKEYVESLDMSDEQALECVNNDVLCTFSATTGECLKNPDYMLYECAPACKSCHKLWEEEPEKEGPGYSYGVSQITDPASVGQTNVDSEAVLEKLAEVDQYMADLKLQNADECINVYAMCTIFAVQGLCETEASMMLEDCAPACLSCQPNAEANTDAS